MKKFAAQVAVVGLGLGLLGTAGPAFAVSDSSSTRIPNTGAILQANAWECSAFVDKCSFATSSKALKNGSAYKVYTITNAATISAHGIAVSISTSPSGSIVDSDTRRISWTNYNTWISDISGIADPSWNTLWMSTCSDAWVYTLGVKAAASACAGN
ncbi:hypothetical protein GCM10027053_48160 [Intrasporangium mesophilum]